GEWGRGRPRLVREFLDRADALALHGRCLSYGEGITFLPLVGALRTAAGVGEETPADEAVAALRRLAGDDAVAERVASVIGLSDRPFPIAELFSPLRRTPDA